MDGLIQPSGGTRFEVKGNLRDKTSRVKRKNKRKNGRKGDKHSNKSEETGNY